MEHHLLPMSVVARRLDLSERTLRRWSGDGLIHRYWWGEGTGEKGPRVSLEEARSLRGDPIESLDGERFFRVNDPRRGYVTIVERQSGQTHGAVALWDAPIDRAVPHPDGLLIRTGNLIGKITRNDKEAWTYGGARRIDLKAAKVEGIAEWEAAQSSLIAG